MTATWRSDGYDLRTNSVYLVSDTLAPVLINWCGEAGSDIIDGVLKDNNKDISEIVKLVCIELGWNDYTSDYNGAYIEINKGTTNE